MPRERPEAPRPNPEAGGAHEARVALPRPPGAARCLPGRLAPHSRWEATQEGPASLTPMPKDGLARALKVAWKFVFFFLDVFFSNI